MKLKLALSVLLLASMSAISTSAQITSDGVSVRNPQNVFFMFPTGANDNIIEIQMGCSTAAVNRNMVFVYELEANGSIVTYPFETTVDCNIQFGGFGGSVTNRTFAGSLVSAITVQTADHTITIDTPHGQRHSNPSITAMYGRRRVDRRRLRFSSLSTGDHCFGACDDARKL